MIDLRLGDCLAILPTLEAGSVDAVVTDPPYGIRYQNKRSDIRDREFAEGLVNDESQKIGQEVINWAFSQGMPVCTFAHHMKPWSGDWRQWLVWDKGGAVGGGGDIATCWKFTWELIQVGGFGVLNGQRDEAVLQFMATQQTMKHHPTQKPVKLISYLIRKLLQEGMTVFDPFMGSGTTGVACVRAGLNFIGCEIHEPYFKIAQKRIAAEQAKMSLFAGLEV
jgi:DNA modification methylase